MVGTEHQADKVMHSNFSDHKYTSSNTNGLGAHKSAHNFFEREAFYTLIFP
jgi:hypothetical protein